MELEERSIEQIGDRCEVCGTRHTTQELEAILESGGPVLCQVHLDELVPMAEEDEGDVS